MRSLIVTSDLVPFIVEVPLLIKYSKLTTSVNTTLFMLDKVPIIVPRN